MASEAVRRTSARIAAHTKWSKTDRVAGTSAARAAFLKRFEDEVDPDRVLSPQVRQQRAANAKTAYFARMALASAKARAASK
jgi:hypothetical protein